MTKNSDTSKSSNFYHFSWRSHRRIFLILENKEKIMNSISETRPADALNVQKHDKSIFCYQSYCWTPFCLMNEIEKT